MVFPSNAGERLTVRCVQGDRAVLCEPASLIYTLSEAQRKAD